MKIANSTGYFANWEHFIEALAESSYCGPLTLESDLPDHLPAPLREKAEQFTADIARYLADRVDAQRADAGMSQVL